MTTRFKQDTSTLDKYLIDLDEVITILKSTQNILPKDIAKLLLENNPSLETWLKPDGKLSPYGVKEIQSFITGHNKRIIKTFTDINIRRFLKDVNKTYVNIINNIHKSNDLNFRVLNSLPEPNIKLYKSPTYNSRQSSSYYLALLNNEEVIYIRKSNHWGFFATNIYDVEEAMKEAALSKEEATHYQKQDPFGRIVRKTHNWNLIGGKKKSDGSFYNTSQIGYIYLRDLI